MATSYTYKPIVSDSLIFHLDAANLKSYGGFSNTWLDLRGSSYNGTLVNSTTFSSTRGGVFSFDGVDDYMSMSAFQLKDGGVFTWFEPSGVDFFRYGNIQSEVVEVNPIDCSYYDLPHAICPYYINSK